MPPRAGVAYVFRRVSEKVRGTADFVCVSRRASENVRKGPGGYFQRVAMMKEAAIAPIPIRMFQLPRTAMNPMSWPAM